MGFSILKDYDLSFLPVQEVDGPPFCHTTGWSAATSKMLTI